MWFNSCIKIDKKPVYFRAISQNNLNFVGQLFQDGKLKTWENIQSEFGLQNFQKFKWLQITHAIPKNWKDIIKDDNGNSKNLVFYDNHLSKGGLIYGLNKLNSKELYHLQINFTLLYRLHKNILINNLIKVILIGNKSTYLGGRPLLIHP